MGEQDIRLMNMDIIQRLYLMIEGFYEGTNAKDSKSAALGEIFKLATRMIAMPNIQSRVFGLNIFNKMRVRTGEDVLKYPDLRAFAKKLAEHKVIDTLLGDNLHEEVITRAKELLPILLTYKEFKIEQMSLLWKNCLNLSAEISKASFELFKEVIKEASEKVI